MVELILRREGDMLRVHVHLVDRAGCLARDRHRGDGRAPTRARGAEAATSDGGEGDGGRSRGGERAGGDPHARAGAPPAPREADPLALEARATGPPLQPGASPARAASAPRARTPSCSERLLFSTDPGERRSVVARYRRSLVCRALAPTALHSLLARIPPRWRLRWTWPHESGPYEVESANPGSTNYSFG